MKFLCVPCDSPMKLQTVGPPERGSLSVVYACPECGYEIAMLTNAYETQVVQSLGVRIGPSTGLGAGPADPSASARGVTAGPRRSSESDVESAKAAGCPFGAMVQGTPANTVQEVRWTATAEARLAKIPEFIRPMARTGIERFARERGALEVDEPLLDAARDFFGM